jgi:hypothetical protein
MRCGLRVSVPPDKLNHLAFILLAGAAGLMAGLLWATIGAAAAAGLVCYFGLALAAHIRADDTKNLPTPILVLALAIAASSSALRRRRRGGGRIMNSGSRNKWDFVAALAAVIALVMIGIYIGLIVQQGGRVAVWFVAGLGAAAILSVYAVARMVPWRRWALAVSGGVMTVLGFVSLPSIGFPILCAGVLALVAAARSSNHHARTSW